MIVAIPGYLHLYIFQNVALVMYLVKNSHVFFLCKMTSFLIYTAALVFFIYLFIYFYSQFTASTSGEGGAVGMPTRYPLYNKYVAYDVF